MLTVKLNAAQASISDVVPIDLSPGIKVTTESSSLDFELVSKPKQLKDRRAVVKAGEPGTKDTGETKRQHSRQNSGLQLPGDQC